MPISILSWDHMKFLYRTFALLPFWKLSKLTSFTLKKAECQVFRSAEVQKSARKFSQGLDFSPPNILYWYWYFQLNFETTLMKIKSSKKGFKNCKKMIILQEYFMTCRIGSSYHTWRKAFFQDVGRRGW